MFATLSVILAAGAIATTPPNTTFAIDLRSSDAQLQWQFPEQTAVIRDGELICDGRSHMSRAFFLPKAWDDVSLSARFLVEPASHGVLACGFIVRATDTATYYYVHFDRTQAILVRSDPDNSWNELQRVSNLKKPAGQWHEGRLECIGDTLKVYLNGTLLYEHHDQQLAGGRIGFYANQGRAHVKDIVVHGQAHSPRGPLHTPPRSFVYVCEDGGAGGYEAFPDVCRLQDGRLMAVFYAGYTHVSLPCERLPRGGRIDYCMSDDEGRTWSRPKTLYDGPHDDRDPSIVQLKSGRLICNFFSLAKSEDSRQNWVGQGTWMVTSEIWGATGHHRGRSRPMPTAAPRSANCRTADLSWGSIARRMGRHMALSPTVTMEATTWSEVIDIDNGGHKLDAETDIIELSDGRLYAAERPTMCYSISSDRGRTWSVSQPIGFEGHCPYFLRAHNDIILLAHRLPSTSLHYSLDEGKTWSQNVLVDNVIGAYPSMVNLKDGSVLIVYYEEGAGSNIRAKRFRASNAGVQWLHFPTDENKTARRLPRSLVSISSGVKLRNANKTTSGFSATSPALSTKRCGYAVKLICRRF